MILGTHPRAEPFIIIIESVFFTRLFNLRKLVLPQRCILSLKAL